MDNNIRRTEALLEIRRLVAFYEISVEQLISDVPQPPKSAPPPAEAATTAAPPTLSAEPAKSLVRYRDAFGHIWDGEGEMPMWLKRYVLVGQSADFYKIDD